MWFFVWVDVIMGRCGAWIELSEKLYLDYSKTLKRYYIHEDDIHTWIDALYEALIERRRNE